MDDFCEYCYREVETGKCFKCLRCNHFFYHCCAVYSNRKCIFCSNSDRCEKSLIK